MVKTSKVSPVFNFFTIFSARNTGIGHLKPFTSNNIFFVILFKNVIKKLELIYLLRKNNNKKEKC